MFLYRSDRCCIILITSIDLFNVLTITLIFSPQVWIRSSLFNHHKYFFVLCVYVLSFFVWITTTEDTLNLFVLYFSDFVLIEKNFSRVIRLKNHHFELNSECEGCNVVGVQTYWWVTHVDVGVYEERRYISAVVSLGTKTHYLHQVNLFPSLRLFIWCNRETKVHPYFWIT